MGEPPNLARLILAVLSTWNESHTTKANLLGGQGEMLVCFSDTRVESEEDREARERWKWTMKQSGLYMQALAVLYKPQ